ncbi:lantibiotic dehydratase [Streptomyces sp. NPDC020379]|uniref:lantibiotic dehydratase n=1 Tax=Streptomyces sp. NPDC020379 TaxID=3365071 RepID=UPI0037955CC8
MNTHPANAGGPKALPGATAVPTGPAPEDTAAAAPPRPAPLGDLFMARVAGLPFESVRGLRSPESCHWATTVHTRRTELAARGAALSDPLHEAIRSNENDELRRTLVNLRRQLFSNKLPSGIPDALAAADALGGSTGQELAAWLRDRCALDELIATGPHTVADELSRTRDALRALARAPRLRQGLLLASPTLDQHLDAYLDRSAGPPAKRQRRIERSLLDYVYRTACKTSPFSTLTGLALGEFHDTGGPLEPSGDILATWPTYARLNVAVLGRIAELVIAHDTLRQDLPVTLVTGWRMDHDRIRYVRRRVTAGDDEATVSFDTVRENLFFLRQGGTLDRLVAVCRRLPGIRYGDLASYLAAEDRRGTVPPPPRHEYDRFLALLLRLGLLQVPALGTDIHSPDPLRAFRDAVAQLATPWAPDLARRLSAVLALTTRYPEAEGADRARLLAALRGELSALQESLGGVPALPRTLLYEDARACDEPLTCDRTRWSQTVGTSLASFDRITDVFDMTLPQRQLLTSFFLARYGPGGRCDDLLGLVHDFQEDIYEQYTRATSRRRPFTDDGTYVPLDNWLDAPGPRALDQARQELADRMRTLWENRPEGAEEIILEDTAVDAVARKLPSPEARRLPHSHFLQLARCDGESVAVLNRTWGAFAFPFSRFTHCFPEGPTGPEERIRAAGRALLPEGAAYAEITGGFATTNLNLHGRLTDYEIVCPGETSSAPPRARIALGDLHLEHDVAEDRLVLRSDRLGREIVPVYLGYLVAAALPEIPRTLLLLSPSSFPVVDLWDGVPQEDTESGISTRPRVRHGHVVLSRRSWTLTAERLPLRQPGTSDAQWFLGWQEWRLRHDIPEQVFATVQAPDDEPAGPAARSKPQYVDFCSFLALTAFEARLHDTTARVVLREALPGGDDAPLVSRDGRHVTELVVETHFTRPEGR